MNHVFYFRGLNTYAEDRIRFGPIRYGTMFGPMQKALAQHDVQLIPLLDMRTGRLKDTIERAKALLLAHPQWDQLEKVHFLGHSTGGLIARALLHEPLIQAKTQSLLTIGSPHLGATAASKVIELALDNSRWIQLAKYSGWDWRQRKEIIGDLSPESVAVFNQNYPHIEDKKYACLLCQCPQVELSLVMSFLSRIVQPLHPSDGLIPIDSQKSGEVVGEFQLDHFTQLGYFPFASGRKRRAHQSEFQRMIREAANYWRSFAN